LEFILIQLTHPVFWNVIIVLLARISWLSYKYFLVYVSYEDKGYNLEIKRKNKNGKDNQSETIYSKENIKKSTVNMLRTLIVMASTLSPLPDDRYLTMKLFYYDERTPEDYEPKFFVAAQGMRV
jgi:hypothetical protein